LEGSSWIEMVPVENGMIAGAGRAARAAARLAGGAAGAWS
jgi:hypothetical protein